MIGVSSLAPFFMDKKEESIVVSLEDMTVILMQLWKSRNTERKCGDLYEKYKDLIPPE